MELAFSHGKQKKEARCTCYAIIMVEAMLLLVCVPTCLSLSVLKSNVYYDSWYVIINFIVTSINTVISHSTYTPYFRNRFLTHIHTFTGTHLSSTCLDTLSPCFKSHSGTSDRVSQVWQSVVMVTVKEMTMLLECLPLKPIVRMFRFSLYCGIF